MNKKYEIDWLLACYENGDTLTFIQSFQKEKK